MSRHCRKDDVEGETGTLHRKYRTVRMGMPLSAMRTEWLESPVETLPEIIIIIVMLSMSSLSEDFENSLELPRMTDLALNISDNALDRLLNNKAISNIPIISSLVAMIETSNNISSYLFARKIIAFLSETNKVGEKQRIKMLRSIEEGKEFKKKVGLSLIEILEKSDSVEKANYLGKWFSAFLKEKISFGQFLYGSHIINSIYVEDLEWFIADTEEWLMIEDAQDEIRSGLFYIDFTAAFLDMKNAISNGKNPDFCDPGAKITDIGKALRMVFNKHYHPSDSYPDPMVEGICFTHYGI